ncbi:MULTISPECIES: DUF1488 family protein [Pseudoalteromonas]|uniref:DUF1488 domain-containing protein n=1 Tax=Pseudoalteromonas amylolytica TaxID=1859457 RepID=A0A1S1MMI1_9GAMM|nr:MULTISPECIES: DUF1488 family protein [Pseudoalteromonas]MCF6437461.1 DUF1488 domain-containing protein [Pseudoalteromonas sp. MMG022]OHU84716.1 hypothetical protein BFC16_00035 [Pseudoalteromonas sp. JW3]OHU86396.1 hypothetical protein BET10_01440 [Pseudoalteromonas amylolytica]
MNQGILFNDDVNVVENTLTFTAMVNGMIVKCLIVTPPMTDEAALKHFQAHQFDYEMQAEQLIEDEVYEEDGSILLAFV